jgi:hypothetical protein
MGWHLHKWTKWETAIYVTHVYLGKNVPTQRVLEERQKRRCRKCNKKQVRDI